ncbi:hypothetical protein GCM10018965_051840 [Nonomuraea roseola]
MLFLSNMLSLVFAALGYAGLPSAGRSRRAMTFRIAVRTPADPPPVSDLLARLHGVIPAASRSSCGPPRAA